MLRTFTAVGFVVALLPWPAGAQHRVDGTPEGLSPPRGYLGLSLQVGQAKGQFADYVDYGGGGGAYLVFRPNRRGPFGVRLDLMYLNYGSQMHSYPLVPGIVVDVTTDNQIFQIALGRAEGRDRFWLRPGPRPEAHKTASMAPDQCVCV